MFYSIDCQTEDQNNFHSFEGPVIEFTTKFLSRTMQMALRTFFVGISIFQQSIDNFKDFLCDQKKSCTIFDYDIEEIMDIKDQILMINSLVSSDDIFHY